MYTLKGELKVVNETQNVTDSFKKREFVVLDDSGQYPQTIMLQAAQDRCDLLDNFKVGDRVEVVFFLRGREWVNPEGVSKYFNSLDAWKIEKIQDSNKSEPTAKQMGDDSDDDLPF